jgi:5-methylcytosine-specific restriction endonuclease McrA
VPVRLCLEWSCDQPATVRGRRAAHASQKERDRRYKRVYASPAWRNSRSRQLFDFPLCSECGRIADTVHHVQPLSVGGAPRAPENLVSLCSPCHTKLHKTGVTA